MIFSTYSRLYKSYRNYETKFANLLQIVDFIDYKENEEKEDTTIILKDLSLIKIFELKGVDFESISIEDKEDISFKMQITIQKLENGFSIENYYVRDYVNKYEYIKSNKCPEFVNYTQEKKFEFWNDMAEQTFQNKIYCVIKFSPKLIKKPLQYYISSKKLFNYNRDFIVECYRKFIRVFNDIKCSFLDFGYIELNRNEIFNFLYKLINRKKAHKYDKNASLISQLICTNYTFFNDHVQFDNGFFCNTLSIKMLPKYSNSMFHRSLFSMPFPIIIKQSFTEVEYKRLEKSLIWNSNIAASLSSLDKKADVFVNEFKGFQNAIKEDLLKPIEYRFYIFLYDKNLNKLIENTAKVDTQLKENGFVTIKEVSKSLKISYFYQFPGHDRYTDRKYTILSNNGGDFFNIYTLHNGDNNPIDFFMDSLNAVYSFVPFTNTLPAHHMCVVGPTGSGKSFLINKMILSSLVEMPYIFVIDLSRSYTEIFQLLKEQISDNTSILTLTLEKVNFKFNPFIIDSEKVEEEQYNFCLNLIKIFLGDTVNDINEYAVRESLQQFFIEYYALLKNTESDPPPPISILISILENKSREMAISNKLKSWTTGVRGKLFNSGIDDFKAAKFLYFDLQALENYPEELAAIVFTIINKIKSVIYKEDLRSEKKLLFLEESHRYLKYKEFIEPIELFIRTGRHYNLLVSFVTQSLNDLITNESWSKSIATNLMQAVFFSRDKNVERAFKILELKDFIIEEYRNLDPGKREFLYWNQNNIYKKLRPLTDLYTYWLSTTSPIERQIREICKEKIFGNDLLKTIEYLVKFGSGNERNKNIINDLKNKYKNIEIKI